MTRSPLRLRAWMTGVVVAGAACLAGVFSQSDLDFVHSSTTLCLVFGIAILIGELRPIVVARGDTHDEITVSTAFAIALTLLGPLAVSVAAMAVAVICQDIRARRGPVKLAFNIAQYTLTLAATRTTYCLISGVSILRPVPGQRLVLPDHLFAALAAGMTFFIISNVLNGLLAAAASGRELLEHLRADLRFQLATSGVLASFAPVVAASSQLTLWLLPLLVLPIEAIHKSARTAAEREDEALHDALTGLANRQLFRMRVARACEQSWRTGRLAAVMLVDLDHFKEINDTLGHHIGDDLLRVVAKRISASLRPGDMVARLGGDEFAVMAGDLSSPADALAVAHRLLEALEEPFEVDSVRLDVQASMGVALFPAHGATMDLLLQRADIALYGAKVDRGSAMLYDAASDVHTPERLTLAAELKEGLDRGELFVEYQPKVHARSGLVIGFEALVRWSHPRHGRLMPDEFLPVVENTGLIGPLTLNVLDMAMAAAAQWRALGHDVPVAVNLSVRHLTDLSLPQRIRALLAEHGLPPQALVLEVTETLIMTDPVRALGVLHLLRDLGVAIAIDDFGTGYSSLAYLRRLEVDELKIDKSFVLDLARDEGNATIVRSTIELGHNLGLRMVAEGVEDIETLALLRSWGCDVVQGYLFSRPLPSADVVPWLSSQLVGTSVPAARAG